MKVFLLSIFLVLGLSACFVTPVFADCSAASTIDLQPWGDFKDQLLVKFPFSILGFAMDILDDLSLVDPESPATMQIHIIGVDLTPLGWLDSEYVDAFMVGFRIIILAVILFSVTKHVIERIL